MSEAESTPPCLLVESLNLKHWWAPGLSFLVVALIWSYDSHNGFGLIGWGAKVWRIIFQRQSSILWGGIRDISDFPQQICLCVSFRSLHRGCFSRPWPYCPGRRHCGRTKQRRLSLQIPPQRSLGGRGGGLKRHIVNKQWGRAGDWRVWTCSEKNEASGPI